MSPIVIDVPKGTEEVYKTFIYSVVENYSPSEIEDFLLGFHMKKNVGNNSFISEEEIFNVLENKNGN